MTVARLVDVVFCRFEEVVFLLSGAHNAALNGRSFAGASLQ